MTRTPPDDAFERLARRDTELHQIATRGRRRALVLLVALMTLITAVVLLLDPGARDVYLAVFVPTWVASLSYSWTKWRRHPEDAQSIAFLGLDRDRRRATYRSLRTGAPLEDAVVLTMVESMHEHQRRTRALMIVAVVAVAGSVAALAVMSGDGTGTAVAVATVVLTSLVIAQHRWLTHRAGEIIGRSHAAAH